MKKILLLIFVFATLLNVDAQDMSAYQKHWMIQGSDSLPFRVLLPDNYDPAKKYPLIFILHGAGESGRDNERQLAHGSKLFLQEDVRKKYPAIVIYPQCAPGDYWSNVLRSLDESAKKSFSFIPEGNPTRSMQLLMQLVYQVREKYPVNKAQVYVGGLSMGGMGTFELVRRCPGIFAAAFPICGGASPLTATRMGKLNWWVFHGAKDDVVIPQHSIKIVNALEKAGASVKFSLYPEANHNSWDAAFAEPGLLPWLFSSKL